MSSTEICESLFVIAGIYLLRHLTACCQPIGCNCTFCCHLMRPDQGGVLHPNYILSLWQMEYQQLPLNMIWSSAKSLLTPQSRNDQSWIMTVSDAESDTFSEKSEFQIRLGFGFGSGLPYCPRVKASAAPLELFSGRLIRLLLIRAVSRWMNTADFGDPRIILQCSWQVATCGSN